MTGPGEQISFGLTRADLAGWARHEVDEATAVFLGEVHDIAFHYWGDGPADWLFDQPVTETAATVLGLVERMADAARTASTAIEVAIGRREWLLAGRMLRCPSCDVPIDPGAEQWRVCRGFAEHEACHCDEPRFEDVDRAYVVADAEDAAYRHERERTGYRTNDLVRLTYPDGRTVDAVWEPTAAGAPAARRAVHGGELLDRADVVHVELLDLAEDAGTPEPDGTPVADPWLDTGMPCGICQRPLAEAPAVWDAGYVVHRHCIPATPTTDPSDTTSATAQTPGDPT